MTTLNNLIKELTVDKFNHEDFLVFKLPLSLLTMENLEKLKKEIKTQYGGKFVIIPNNITTENCNLATVTNLAKIWSDARDLLKN